MDGLDGFHVGLWRRSLQLSEEEEFQMLISMVGPIHLSPGGDVFN